MEVNSETEKYDQLAIQELKKWQEKSSKEPSPYSRLTKSVQKKINRVIPEKFHEVVTEAIKAMVKAVLFGSKYTTSKPLTEASLMEREKLIKKKFNYYRGSAVASGAGTGAGGFLLGLADFPILLGIKMKFLFSVASLYGFDVKGYKERLFILHVFQMAFSNADKRVETYQIITNWNEFADKLPPTLEDFNWREFQQEYRDYIDLAKMLQMLPGLGAVFGAFANFRLMDRLHNTALNCYRLRVL